MKFVEVNPSLLTQLNSLADANPITFPAFVVLGALFGAWMFASYTR